MLITFEGLPTCGKKTQIALLEDKLRLHHKVDTIVTTGEPGWNKETSGILRYLIMEGNTSPTEKLFLALADRAGHFRKKIGPCLERHGMPESWDKAYRKPVVLCDGGPDATLAYQGFGSSLAPLAFLVQANEIAMEGLIISLTIVLTVSPETAIRRSNERLSMAVENKRKSFYQKVAKGYEVIAHGEPSRVFLIDGERDPNIIGDEIYRLVSGML